MLLEALVASSCFYGNGTSCQSSLTSYGKYTGIEKQLQEMSNRVSKRYPSVVYFGIVVGVLTQKKYEVMIYKGFGANLDVSDPNNVKEKVFIKYSF